MNARTVTVTLPEDLYTQLESQARTAARSVDDLVAQTIARGLMLVTDPDLPPTIQVDLAAMEHLADDMLWEIAGSTASSDTIALYDLLTERQQDRQLTAQGQQWLQRVREEIEALMLRKAHAYVLLKQRGYQLPAIENLPVPTP